MVPSYADKIKKVEVASGVSMAVMIYVVSPLALGLSALSKLCYHATSETWKIVEGGEKWTGQQVIPKPKGKVKLEKMTIPEADAPDTVPAHFTQVLIELEDQNN